MEGVIYLGIKRVLQNIDGFHVSKSALFMIALKISLKQFSKFNFFKRKIEK